MSIETTALRMMSVLAKHPRKLDPLFRFSKWGNPFAEENYRWPYPAYERMRAGGPVIYSRAYRQWFVFGFDEAQQVLASPNVSTVRAAKVMLDMPWARKLTPQVRTDFSQWLLTQDPPNHTRLRLAVGRAFSPNATRTHEDAVTVVIRNLLNELPQNGEFDLVEHFTAKLPINVIAQLLGLPLDRWAWLRRLSHSTGSLLEVLAPPDPATVNRDGAELHEFFRSVVAERRLEPKDDLISALTAHDAGGDLTNDEVIAMIGFVLFAGHETMTGALGNAIMALERYPAQRALLRSTPGLIANAVEELLRFDPSVRITARTSTGPVTVGDTTIPPNAIIGVFVAAANRDERRWTNANELLLDRPEARSITFGHGIHHCLGASLARMQLRSALVPLLERLDGATIDETKVEWKRSATLRGPTRIPVRLAG